MNAFKRRRPEVETTSPEPEQTAPASPQVVIPNHVQRTLIMLTTKLQVAMERIEQLEAQIEELNDQTLHAPSHSDVLEVRMHGAKLAAELARTTVELRGEIGMANDEARRAARVARTAMNAEPDIVTETLDLVAEERNDEADHRSGPGYSQTA